MSGADKIGDFEMKDANKFLPKEINIAQNADAKLLIVTFDGDEQLVVNGQPQPQDNGANLSAACVNNEIHVTGKGPSPDNAFTDFRLKPSDDGKTLAVTQNEPSKATYQYGRTNAGVAALKDGTKKLLEKLTGHQPKSGLPAPEDQKKK